jgi:ABC-type phosphate transport system substrate-binding protein
MRGLLSVTTIAALTALSGAVSGEARPSAYEVIVNPTNSASSIDHQFLAEAFLKKTTEWPDGTVIQPVDLPSDSPVRRRFSDEVLHRSVSEVKVYWQQRIFSGRDVPPPELDTNEAVVAYVLKYAGAVGYVSSGAALGGAKVVSVK